MSLDGLHLTQILLSSGGAFCSLSRFVCGLHVYINVFFIRCEGHISVSLLHNGHCCVGRLCTAYMSIDAVVLFSEIGVQMNMVQARCGKCIYLER